MRWAEILLFAVPVVAATLWWFGPRHLSRRAVTLIVLALAFYAWLLLYLGEARRVQGVYQPARLDGGKVVPGNAN